MATSSKIPGYIRTFERWLSLWSLPLVKADYLFLEIGGKKKKMERRRKIEQIERADRFVRNLGYRAVKKKARVEDETDLKPRIVSLWFIQFTRFTTSSSPSSTFDTRALNGGARKTISSFLKEQVCRLRRGGGRFLPASL